MLIFVEVPVKDYSESLTRMNCLTVILGVFFAFSSRLMCPVSGESKLFQTSETVLYHDPLPHSQVNK